MDQVQVDELKESYYEYINKIPQGLQTVVNFFANNEVEKALEGVANLAEGLVFLVKVEEALKDEGLVINSRLNEGLIAFEEINTSLINGDYLLLKELLEYELIPLFSSASEWFFIQEGE